MALSNPTTQGGQTFLHRIRMIIQIVKLSGSISIPVFAITFITIIYWTISTYLWTDFYVFQKAKLLVFIFSDDNRWGVDLLTHKNVIADLNMNANMLYMAVQFKKAFLISFLSTLMTIFLLFTYWKYKGQKDNQTKHIHGQVLEDVNQLTRRIKRNKEASHIMLGSVPMIKNTETQHMLITGTTGSGKTNCFHHLLKQLRNQKVVILDTTGEFVERCFDPKRDIILNPLDERTKQWHVWAECEEDYHFDEIAENLIPHTSHDVFWTNASRIVLAESLRMMHKNRGYKTSELMHLLIKSSLESLARYLKDTKAASIIDMQSEKTAASIRINLTAAIQSLGFLEDADKPFSIRKWMQDDERALREIDSCTVAKAATSFIGYERLHTTKQNRSRTESSESAKGGWLFLHMLPEQRATLRPLVSTWASIAIKSLMGCVPNTTRKVWFILDELPSLHKLTDLSLCLAEGRKYGACIAVGVQNMPQLREIYGDNASLSIIDLCSTKVIFRMASHNVALQMSKLLGEREVLEVAEGISYGANDMRDGVNLNLHRRQKFTVTPHDLMSLRNLESYVILPGNYPVSKVGWEVA